MSGLTLRNNDSGSKEIVQGGAARLRMLKGFESITETVASTLGPFGRSVIIEDPHGRPQITRDGHTIARSIELWDRVADMGARILREITYQTDDRVGDGTTTAAVLAGKIAREGVKAITAGLAPLVVKRGIDRATAAALVGLERRARPMRSKHQVAAVGTVSANGDTKIGALVAQALEEIGEDGFIMVEEGSSRDTELEIRHGMHFESGNLSPHFANKSAGMLMEMEQPFVLVHDGKITSFVAIEPVLRAFAKSGKWLLLIAHDVVGEALATLMLNQRGGEVKLVAVRAPNVGSQRKAMLEDIAIMTGAELVGDGLGHTLDKLRPEMLGRAARVVVDDKTTVIVEGRGAKEAVENRCRNLRADIQREQYLSYDRERLQERLARLVGGVAVLRVGGDTEVEIKYGKQIFTDAVNATRAAVVDGIVPGGGVALLGCIADLEFLTASSSDEYAGIEVIRRALTAPLRCIADNAGLDGASIVAQILDCNEPDWGFDVRRGRYTNLMQSGVIDPVRVVRTALANAASVGSFIMTSEVAIANHAKATRPMLSVPNE